MANITNSSPVVTEDKLKDFYEDIKPFLGCPAYVTQEGDEMYFSFNEKVVGRWTNNKPLYQKTVIFSPAVDVSSTSWTNTPISRGDIEFIINIDGWYDSGTGFQSRPLMAFVDSGSSVVKLLSGRDGVTQDTISGVIFQYTKTTDSAATTIEQKPTHYSTDEQVVGVWTNNKPIYQKTFSTTAPNAPSNGSYGYNSFAHGIQNLDEYVEISGVITSSEFSSMLPFFTDGGYKTKFNISATEISIANDATYANGRKISITVKYTKSTD